MVRFALGLVLTFCAPRMAWAIVLEVGPGMPFAQPSTAIAKARDGDTVRVHPGVYVDCATIAQNNLTLEGVGGTVTMRDKTCGGKAILVVTGPNVTIRGLTLANAKVPDQNGAGIRAEGGALLVQNTQFLNNQEGILSSNAAGSSIRIVNSVFIGNGICNSSCAHGVYAGQIASLRIEHSRFFRQMQGHHIKSRATRTEIVGCDIADGPDGTASVSIDIPSGGTVLIQQNTIEKGPKSPNWANTIMIAAEGASNRPGPIVVQNNRLTNDDGHRTTFVHNFGTVPAALTGNTFVGQVQPLLGPGTVH